MRPAFHFTPAAGWINDPHGLHHHDGEYHAFFQYIPERTEWSEDIHWGHAKGPDLLSLEELPVAIFPGEGDGGIWTGSLVVDDEGAARIFYTSTSRPDLDHGRIRVATPESADWVAWHKGGFVVETPAEMSIFRDPWVFRDEDGWSMVVSGRHQDGAAALVSLHSDDLEAWTYRGVALRPSDDAGTALSQNTLWECPQLFEIGGRHVLVLSVEDEGEPRYVGYAIGHWAGGRFDATSWGRLSFGRSPYAPTFFRDEAGRPSLEFWLSEVAGEGWAGALSVPYLLALEGERLVLEPHPDLERFRSDATGTDVDRPAADIVWDARPGAELSIVAADGEIVALRMTWDLLFVETAVQASSIPAGGSVRIIVDGPLVEVATRRGVYAAQIPASRGFVLTGDVDAVQAYPLVRAGA